jgi:hypothetical protein
MANHSNRLLEKPLGCFHIPFLTQHRINETAIVIDSAIQITPFPFDFDIGFIDVSRLACLSAPFGPQLLCNE